MDSTRGQSIQVRSRNQSVAGSYSHSVFHCRWMDKIVPLNQLWVKRPECRDAESSDAMAPPVMGPGLT